MEGIIWIAYRIPRSSSEKIRIRVPSGDVLTKILPSIVQTLNRVPSLLCLLASFTSPHLYIGGFSFMKINQLLLRHELVWVLFLHSATFCRQPHCQDVSQLQVLFLVNQLLFFCRLFSVFFLNSSCLCVWFHVFLKNTVNCWPCLKTLPVN